MKKYFIIIALLFLPLIAQAQEIKFPIVKIIDLATLQTESEFYPYGSNDYVFDTSIDVADLNNDQIDEIIIGSGEKQSPRVLIFNQKGELKNEFLAFDEKYTNGVRVAAGDLENDGQIEIIATKGPKGDTMARIYDYQGKNKLNLYGFTPEDLGGANVKIGDINKDGQNEIIAASGETLTPQLKFFTNRAVSLTGLNIYKNWRYGANIELADLNHDGYEEIIAAPALGDTPTVRVYNYFGDKLAEFNAYNKDFTGGVNLDVADLNYDGEVEIITGAGFGGSAQIRFFDKDYKAIKTNQLFVFENFKGGVIPKIIRNKNILKLAVITQYIPKSEFTNNYKMIEVDLSKQRLYVYNKSILENEIKISSGIWKYPTPAGNFKVTSKIKSGRMSHVYGPGHPDNYDLANVPNILPFKGPYTIHGAYWHNNFGRRMSHGCVNLSIKDSKWMFDWADVGVPVHIYNSKQK